MSYSIRVIKRDIYRKIKTYYYYIRDIYFRDSLKIDAYSGYRNFGDILNYTLLKQLTGKRILEVRSQYYGREHYLVIGSVLQRANKHSTVWGSGFISKESHCDERPHKVYAVRGPLTREKLLEDGIACPEIYGDPALLLPLIYTPKIKKRYKLGIIPHYIDKSNSWIQSIQSDEVAVLDIQTEEPFALIDKILECEKIASSSLHGIIIADAYAIPSLWIKLSNKITGGSFKFLDYFESVNREDREAFLVSENTSLADLYQQFKEYKIDIDLGKLIEASPFNISISNNKQEDKI